MGVLVVLLVACLGGLGLAAQSLAQSVITLTAPPVPTAKPTPSPTAGPVLTGTGMLLYQTTFDGATSGWINDSARCFFSADGYHIKNNSECYAPVGIQSDVTIKVTVKQVSGPTTAPYGIFFRQTGPASEYQYDIDSNGKWAFYRSSNGTVSTLIDHTANSSFTGGLNTTNTMEVRAKGLRFDFFINDVWVGGMENSSAQSGTLGLLVGPNAECVFTNLTVTRQPL